MVVVVTKQKIQNVKNRHSDNNAFTTSGSQSQCFCMPINH